MKLKKPDFSFFWRSTFYSTIQTHTEKTKNITNQKMALRYFLWIRRLSIKDHVGFYEEINTKQRSAQKIQDITFNCMKKTEA
ncbi:hypothetical protein EO95_00370 [Methanosarcina sp. 1.H.T.1A.1]|nr:hypothetical protein EO95_00370 [Methanosarcina sp. 1.H.T.1A.1]